MAIYNLHNPYEVQQFKEYCLSLIKICEKSVDGFVEIKRKHRKRSTSQNSYLHVVLSYYASEFGYSLEEVKYRFYKVECNKDIFVRKRTNKRGSEVDYVRSSSELDTAEMTLSIERFRNWSVSVCGLYIPAPDEYEALMYAQKQIEQNLQYI